MRKKANLSTPALPPNQLAIELTSSLLLLTGGDLGLLGTLYAVTSALDFLLGFTGVLEVLNDDLGLKEKKVSEVLWGLCRLLVFKL
jgi:hypothetical protein